MATKLFLDSLEIRNFRAFEHLRIERLGRVNLIVGKNNVGKSSLLEALWLYANHGHPSIIWAILEARDEGISPGNSINRKLITKEPLSAADYLETIHQLFRRADRNTIVDTLEIGPIEPSSRNLVLALDERIDLQTNQIIPVIKVFRNGEVQFFDVNVEHLYKREGFYPRCLMIEAKGLGGDKIEEFWDRIALTNLEDDVLNALQLIAPQVKRINLLTVRRTQAGRIPVVRADSISTPVPLRSLGEGMNRLFGIALALVNAKDGILLIDEIESGLHYSVQPDIWRLVFEVARRLNIQVFATTHSWDCLTAFQEAAKADEQEEGVLIRLTEKKGHIVADLFNEDELVIVAREGIEIR